MLNSLSLHNVMLLVIKDIRAKRAHVIQGGTLHRDVELVSFANPGDIILPRYIEDLCKQLAADGWEVDLILFPSIGLGSLSLEIGKDNRLRHEGNPLSHEKDKGQHNK